MLHGSPCSAIRAVKNGIGTTCGVIIQFPVYAGIFGIIVHSGLAHIISAVSTGGPLANLIQPFRALPFIAACKIRFQAILPCAFLLIPYGL